MINDEKCRIVLINDYPPAAEVATLWWKLKAGRDRQTLSDISLSPINLTVKSVREISYRSWLLQAMRYLVDERKAVEEKGFSECNE